MCPNVLLVEADPLASFAIQHDLQALGAQVAVARDGLSALAQLTDSILSLDLLVTALELPRLDGLSLIRLVRVQGGEGGLPILAMGDEGTEGAEAHLAALGAEVVHKSAGLDALVARALRLLEERGWFGKAPALPPTVRPCPPLRLRAQ